MQEVSLRIFGWVQLRHSLLEGPEHVLQSRLQRSHVLVAVFPNLLEGQVATHVVPSKKVPIGQDKQWLLVAPEHVLQSL